jgi:hypothetical protein
MKDDTQKLVELAARKYPIGTKYRPLDDRGETSHLMPNVVKAIRYPKALVNGIDVGCGYVYNYKNEKWAEIIEAKEEVIELNPLLL